MICLSFTLPGKRQRKNQKVPEVTVVLLDSNDTEKSANPGEWRVKKNPLKYDGRWFYFAVCKTFLERFSLSTAEGQEKDLRGSRCAL